MTGKKGINVSGMTICAILGIAASLAILSPILKEYVGKPGYADYQNLNQLLQENYRQGDYVLFEPKWLRGFARDLSRLQFIPDYGDNVFERGLAERIWYVSPTDKLPKTSLKLVEKNSKEIGRLRVTLYEVERAHPLLYELLGQASAMVGDVEGRWDGSQIIFDGLPEWTSMRKTTEYFKGDAHTGVFFHPMAGERREITLKLSRGSFYLTYGLRQRFDCNPNGKMQLGVRVNNVEVFEDSMTIKNAEARHLRINLPEDDNRLIVDATTEDDKCMHFFINGYHVESK